MLVTASIEKLQAQVAQWRAAGQRVGFVPTLGNLHAGHIKLVEHAGTLADKTIASVYVNPTQFGANEDLHEYPRTLVEDQEKLTQVQCDLLFIPSDEILYPFGLERTTKITVTGISHELCGVARPEHFIGVATVVAKLLLIVKPDLAVFGEKDRQQLAIIRQMVQELFLPVDIIAHATVREPDGLAMSSRNRYLSQQQRALAPALYQTLCWLRDAIIAGNHDFEALQEQGRARLVAAGFQPDYISVRQLENLAPLPDALAAQGVPELVVLGAANLGTARLIDNVVVKAAGQES